MGFTQRFLSGFGSWRRKRSDRKSHPALEPVADRPEKDATDRFRRRREVDDDTVFGERASSSQRKHRKTGRFCDPIIAELIQDQWSDFFACFRDDERDFELARFKEQAASIQAELDTLGEDGAPDLVVCRQMLYLLSRFVGERFGTFDERLDQLLAENRDLQAQLNAIKLSTSWQSDELAYIRSIITSALKSRDTFIGENKDGTPLLVSELLCQLLSISKAPPRPQAYGRRATTRTEQAAAAPSTASGEASEASDTAAGELATVRRVLRDLLDGKATVGKVNRVLEDEELALRLAEVASKNRQYRAILKRIGLLPEATAESDP